MADLVPQQRDDDGERLVAALNESNATVRRWAAIALLARGPATGDVSKRLGMVLEDQTDPFVVIPCAEALARYSGSKEAVGTLAALAGSERRRAVRLEALNALTAIDRQSVAPFRETVAVAANESDEYLRRAGEYLLLQIGGTYTPESAVLGADRAAGSTPWAKGTT